MLIHKKLVVGSFQCNCSLLICPKTKEAIVIDPGDEFEKISKLCKSENIKLKYVFHTHAHLDHIGASGELKKQYPESTLCLHKGDDWLFKNLVMQGQLFGISYDNPPSIDRYVEDEEEFEFGEAKFSIIHTPGHSPGGVCLRFKDGLLDSKPFLFTGDSLFDHSVGRTDLWEGDFSLLAKSIKTRLFTLDEETIVSPGHGTNSLIGIEKRENPFLS